MACEELERLIHAYTARVQVFVESVRNIRGKEKSIMEWQAECWRRVDECEHASAVLMRHVAEHGCVSLSPLPKEQRSISPISGTAQIC